MFFNAPYFKQQAQAAIRRAGPELKWFVLDALPITQLDVTGFAELEDLSETLHRQGAELVISGRLTETEEAGRAREIDKGRVFDHHFPTLRQAVKGYRSAYPAGPGGTGAD